MTTFSPLVQVFQRVEQSAAADDVGGCGERGPPADRGDGGECWAGRHQGQTLSHRAGCTFEL